MAISEMKDIKSRKHAESANLAKAEQRKGSALENLTDIHNWCDFKVHTRVAYKIYI